MTDEGGNSFRRLSRRWYLGCRLLDALKYGKLQDVVSIVKTPDIDPNIIVPEYGIAPMHCAAGIEPEEFGVKCIQELLRVGGDANVRCSEGVTPVHVASCWGRLNVLKLLLGSGGDPYLLDDNGKDAFYYAQGSEKVFYLLKNNISISNECNATDIDKYLDKDRKDITIKKAEEFDMNASAFSLIMKHRQGILLFESLPSEEDTSSSTTLDTEFNEDFSFEPKDLSKVFSDSFKEDESRAHSDSEICTEDIHSSDMTNVIKVINDNVNRSKSHLSFHEEFSDSVPLSMNKKNLLVDKKWTDSSTNQVVQSYNSEQNHETDVKTEKILNKPMNLSSSNILEPKDSNSQDEAIREELKEIKSDFSLSSPSSYEHKEENIENEPELMRKNNYSFEPKVKEKVIEVNPCLVTPQISETNIQLPKKVREKLLCFKVNTHYKTKVYKLVSRSCDGLTSKKSLYTTGYEFWSTRVKSKSYPCYIGPLKYREKITQQISNTQ